MAQQAVDYAGIGSASLSNTIEDEDGPYTFHGVALGAGDITIGKSGDKKLWTEEALEAVADTLEGKKIVKNHENNAEGTIGKVTKASFKSGVGVLYEGEIAEHYDEFAKDIAAGILDVSPRIYHMPTEELDEDEETGAYVIDEESVGPFDNLAVVSDGASPSNTAAIGEASAMATGQDGQAVAVLEQGSTRPAGGDVADELGAGVDEVAELGHAGTLCFYGHISDMVDQDQVEGVADDLSDHDALTATLVGEEGDQKIVAIVDTSQVDSIDDLNEHIIGTLDETPFAVYEEYSWLDEVMRGEYLEDGVEDDDVEAEEAEDASDESDDGVEAEEAESDETEDAEAEELETAWHTPDWSGLDDSREWSKPSLEDFDTDDLGEIADHFFVSKTGEWPPENYGDLALPAVWPNGDLSLDGLDSVHQMAGQTDGVSDDMADSIQSKANSLAEEHFDESITSEEESEENESGDPDDRDVTEAATGDTGDDGHTESQESGQSTTVEIAALNNHNNVTMTEISTYEIDGDELDDGHVAVDEEELQSLVDKADRADELDDRLDDMNSTLDELSEHRETLNEVDEESLEDLREFDDARVLTGEEYEEMQDLVSEVAEIYAEELEEYSPFTADELTDRFSPTELKAKVEEHDEAELGTPESDDPEPEGGSADAEELSGDGEETPSDDAEFESEEELREHVAGKLEADGLSRQAEKVRDGDIDVADIVEGAPQY